MRRKNGGTDLTPPRQWPRLTSESTPSFFKGITLSQGRNARVIDISCGGALIESDVRLCPHAKVGFKVLTPEGVLRLTGSVLRSSVKALLRTPVYHSAIVFEKPLTMLDGIEPSKTELEGIVATAVEKNRE